MSGLCSRLKDSLDIDSNQEIHYMERVLVVEDDSFFRETFRDLLREDGYEVDVAASGAEAIEKLRKQYYHVVVTDLVMQGINGLDLLSNVKQYDSSIEVILVTGHANVETAIYALKNGARDYLVKPINQDELKHTVALCVEQRRLLDENLELKRQINLFQVSQTIANCLELERIYSLVVDALAKEVDVSRGIGYFLEGDNLVLKELKMLDKVTAERIGSSLSAHFKTQKKKSESIIVRIDDEFLKSKDINKSLLLFIRSKTHLQGVIILFNEPGKEFRSDINQKNLHFLLEQSSLALDNASRFAMARNLANIDELTGLFNYRYLDVALDHEIKRTGRYGSSLALIFLDLDLFKNVNDVHGHLIGSKVLKEVGVLLKNLTREVDLVFRYGGDEFTIILIETGMAGAARVAERIRMCIEDHIFLANEGYSIKITACLGYSVYPDDSKSKIELLELADQAMYHGKLHGKNVVSHLTNNRP
jgi:diguanylate cyclase (GGDEF)-like protein